MFLIRDHLLVFARKLGPTRRVGEVKHERN